MNYTEFTTARDILENLLAELNKEKEETKERLLPYWKKGNSEGDIIRYQALSDIYDTVYKKYCKLIENKYR